MQKSGTVLRCRTKRGHDCIGRVAFDAKMWVGKAMDKGD